MEYLVQNFLESPLYKSFEKWAEEEVGSWPCIMQDCLEEELFNRGVSREYVRKYVNAATKKFQQDHKAEIDAAWKKVLEKTNTTRAQVLEVQATINAAL